VANFVGEAEARLGETLAIAASIILKKLVMFAIFATGTLQNESILRGTLIQLRPSPLSSPQRGEGGERGIP